MNEDYILLACYQSQAVNMLVLNTKGELIHTVTEKIFGEELENWELYKYPVFGQLSGNTLIYKSPQELDINFWHIPTKKLVTKFNWQKSIYDLPLFFEDCLLQDIRFSNEKLTLLLSTEHTPLSNKPAKFRIIQFDTQNTQYQGLMSLPYNIFSVIKDIYYAFPGKQLQY